MKNSIKREQSQACLNFAERLRVGELCSGMRKNFRLQAKQKILMTLALLITAATGAWAQGAFSSDPYTSTTEFNDVSVTSSMTLNINEGVIVTVNSGLTIEDGVTLTLTGGGRLSVFGKSGNWGMDASYVEGTRIYEATAGEDGKTAITLNGNAKIVIDNGEIYAEGGLGGLGGTDEIAGINQPDGAAGNAFSRFPTIDGATLYYNSSNEWFKCTSGDQTLYNEMKAVPATFEVTIDNSLEQPTASFEMPQYDVTATYTIKRDISVDVTATMGDGTDGVRYRVKKAQQGEGYEPADLNMMQVLALVAVNDGIEQKALTLDQDYFCRIYKLDEQTLQPEGDGVELIDFDFAPGLYALKAVAKADGDYAGETALSNIFVLFEGYQVVVPAGEFATFYKDEPLYADTETSADAELYTISSVNGDQAVLSDAIETAPSYTPLLVYNKGDQDKTFLLIPVDAEPNLALTVFSGFKGTLVARTTDDTSDNGPWNKAEGTTYYALNGLKFVYVNDAIAVGANRCWLEIGSQAQSARQLNLVFGEATGINGAYEANGASGNSDWYDLSGRKLNAAPTRKGVFIKDGKKIVIK